MSEPNFVSAGLKGLLKCIQDGNPTDGQLNTYLDLLKIKDAPTASMIEDFTSRLRSLEVSSGVNKLQQHVSGANRENMRRHMELAGRGRG